MYMEYGLHNLLKWYEAAKMLTLTMAVTAVQNGGNGGKFERQLSFEHDFSLLKSPLTIKL